MTRGRSRGGGRHDGAGPAPGFQRVGSVLDEVLRGLRLEERFAAAEATDVWVSAVGPEIAARTRCEGVRDGELLVSVRGATWMGDLAVRKYDILNRINEALAEGAKLRAIRLVPMRGKEGSVRDATR